MYHTTNPIDTKIEPQIALIAADFSISFFDVISAFKGDYQIFSHNFFEFLARLSLGHKGFTKNSRFSSKNSQFNV